MDKGAVEAIAELQKKNTIVQEDGLQFVPQDLNPVIYEPTPQSIELDSLSGLVELVNEPVDEELADRSGLMIHVASHREVFLYGKLWGKKRKRDLYAKVELNPELKSFPFDSFMDSESFQIKLRSQFTDTDDLIDLLTFTSRLTVNDEVGTKDDGVTQEVSLRRGMSGAVTERGQSKPIVVLRPYRTFREIKQPASEFLFRMKPIEGKIPTLALFEADGGTWKLEAVNSIAEYFQNALEDVKVVY